MKNNTRPLGDKGVKPLLVLLSLLFSSTSIAGDRAWYLQGAAWAGTNGWYATAQEACDHHYVFNDEAPYVDPSAEELGPGGGTPDDMHRYCFGTIPSNGNKQFLGTIYASMCSSLSESSSGYQYCVTDDADEDDGCDDDLNTDHPCNVATGNKYRSETDITKGALSFTRSYNSRNLVDLGLGMGWRHNHQKKLVINGDTLKQISGTGRGEPWAKIGGVWQGEADSDIQITQDSNGYKLTRPNGVVERYNSSGQLELVTQPNGQQTVYVYNNYTDLESVTNEFGLSLTFGYTDRKLTSVTDAAGAVYRYEYDENDNLITVIYPDLTPSTPADNPRKVYIYGETVNFPNHLSGIIDENGDRYAKFTYQADGLVSTSELAITSNTVGQEKITISYDLSGNRTVTDATGNDVNWTIQEVLGASKLVSKIHQSDLKGVSHTYDANGNRTSSTDAEGRVTKYFYNATNQKTSMIEAFGTAQERTTTYEYVSADVDLVTKVITPSVRAGNVKTVTTGYTAELNVDSILTEGFDLSGQPVSRETIFQYDSHGRITQVDESRTDVSDITTLEYYPNCTTGGECGQLKKVSNALGHTTTYDSYDAAGRLTQSTDPHGVTTTYTYHPRGWVASITQTPPVGSLPDETSRYEYYQYDNVGQLIQVTQADGSIQYYDYDEAHYLTRIYDELGNQIKYAYDSRGNRSEERVVDPNEILEQEVIRTYDARKFVEIVNRGGTITTYTQDATGQPDTVTDPKQVVAADYSYDALKRLIGMDDALIKTTSYQYDIADNLTQVTAPNNATTQFEYDDLGNLTKETSPDRGVINYTHDDAGNVTTMTDARGVVTTYQYDALNRVVSVSYPQATENVSYTYDVGVNCGAALGRVCQVIDATGTQTYTYDVWGNVLTYARDTGATVLETHYAYDAMNRITQMVYPSGLVIDYERDAIGRVLAVHAPKDSLTEIVADEFEYRADGQVSKTRLGSDQVTTRSYDAQGRLEDQWVDSNQLAVYEYDVNGNLVDRTEIDQERAFVYDVLDRLEKDDRISGLSGSDWEFDYDANGNRTKTEQDSSVSLLGYNSNSNRLTSIAGNAVVTDAAGNIISLPRGGSALTLEYNQQNYLASVTNAGLTTNYTTNHQRQRLTKSSAGATTHYVYDLGGRLLATTDANGVVDEEYVYANEASLSPIYHRLYEDTEANTVEAAQALEKSERSIADPVDGQGQCNGYERTESDRNNSSARRFDNGSGGVLTGGTEMFTIPNNNIGWFIPILMWYLDDGPPEIIDLEDDETEPEPIDQPEIIVTWTPAPAVLEHVVDVATTKRALNNQPDVARHCVQSNENQVQINHIPLNGTKVYVRLWSKDNGVWTYEDFEFETTGSSDPKAYITRTYLIDDHLSTPRFGYDDEKTLTWRWASDGFGREAPRDDPDADGIQNNINIRFPGQYYDYESGLHYNWNRYYDSSEGRYVSSDPIGYDGGLNTYGYVSGNPMIYYDPTGLKKVRCIPFGSTSSDWREVRRGTPTQEQALSHSFTASLSICTWSRYVPVHDVRTKRALKLCIETGTCSGWPRIFYDQGPEVKEDRIHHVLETETSSVETFYKYGYVWKRCYSPWNRNIVAEGPAAQQS